MHKTISCLLGVFAFFLLAGSAHAAGMPPVINEFYVAGDNEWVELFNPTYEAVNLNGYTLVPTYGSSDEVALSGILPKQGFLTFYMAPNTFDDDGGALILKNPEGNPIFSVYYGNISGTPHVAAPGVDQSANAAESGGLQDSDWSVGDPSKGWCASESHGCINFFAVSYLLDMIGIRTNLHEISDPSRSTDLFFQAPYYGSIFFSNEQNLTDPDISAWLLALEDKIQIEQQLAALDTDMIDHLIDTKAWICMYNVSLDNPQILVNGEMDLQNIVSDLDYNKANQTLCFTVAHFTTFTAVEGGGHNQQQTSSSSSSATASAPGCDLVAPLDAPDLFQIERTGSSANLYFSPVLENSSEYVISYGFAGNDWRFGTSLPKLQTSGVEQVAINHLDPKATYWFTVRTGNGCATGPWSSWLEAKPSKTTHKY